MLINYNDRSSDISIYFEIHKVYRLLLIGGVSILSLYFDNLCYVEVADNSLSLRVIINVYS